MSGDESPESTSGGARGVSTRASTRASRGMPINPTRHIPLLARPFPQPTSGEARGVSTSTSRGTQGTSRLPSVGHVSPSTFGGVSTRVSTRSSTRASRGMHATDHLPQLRHTVTRSISGSVRGGSTPTSRGTQATSDRQPLRHYITRSTSGSVRVSSTATSRGAQATSDGQPLRHYVTRSTSGSVRAGSTCTSRDTQGTSRGVKGGVLMRASSLIRTRVSDKFNRAKLSTLAKRMSSMSLSPCPKSSDASGVAVASSVSVSSSSCGAVCVSSTSTINRSPAYFSSSRSLRATSLAIEGSSIGARVLQIERTSRAPRIDLEPAYNIFGGADPTPTRSVRSPASSSSSRSSRDTSGAAEDSSNSVRVSQIRRAGRPPMIDNEPSFGPLGIFNPPPAFASATGLDFFEDSSDGSMRVSSTSNRSLVSLSSSGSSRDTFGAAEDCESRVRVSQLGHRTSRPARVEDESERNLFGASTTSLTVDHSWKYGVQKRKY